MQSQIFLVSAAFQQSLICMHTPAVVGRSVPLESIRHFRFSFASERRLAFQLIPVSVRRVLFVIAKAGILQVVPVNAVTLHIVIVKQREDGQLNKMIGGLHFPTSPSELRQLSINFTPLFYA